MSRPALAMQEILEGLDAMDIDSAARQKVRLLVGAIAGAHGFAWIERATRIAHAKDLMRLRVPRPVIRDRLMALYGISRPQAYRIITNALQVSS
jgi:hypothetical protein